MLLEMSFIRGVHTCIMRRAIVGRFTRRAASQAAAPLDDELTAILEKQRQRGERRDGVSQVMLEDRALHQMRMTEVLAALTMPRVCSSDDSGPRRWTWTT